MKWFRHNTDSHTNLKLRSVIHEFGAEGYGLYWLCLELVGQQGSSSMNFLLNQNRTWMHALCTISALDVNLIEKVLQRFCELELIDAKSLKEGKLHIPKMKDYLDTYTLRSLSEVHSKSVCKLYGNVMYCKDFEDIWIKYPNRVGKKEAYRHFQATVKTPEDIKNIGLALENYVVSDIATKEGGKYVQNAKTWFNNWQDWVVPPKTVDKWAKYMKKEKKRNDSF